MAAGGDHRLRGGQDRPRAAVADRQLEDGRVGVLAPEVPEVLPRRGPEPVDALVVVAGDPDAAMVLAQEPQHQPLGEVHVLEVVHEHVREALRRTQAHVGALVQESEGPQHEVARVEPAALAHEPVVVGVEAGELGLARRARARRVVGVAGGLRRLARVRDGNRRP